MTGSWLENAIRTARETQQSILTDRVRVETQTGETVDDLGTVTQQWTTIYEGPGLVQLANAPKPTQVVVSGEPVTVYTHIGKVPHTVVLDDTQVHRMTVVKSLDPANLGVYQIVSVGTQAWVTVRRLLLKRV